MSTERAELRTATDAAIGRRVHMMMWDRRLTQATLASDLDLKQSGLSKKLRGERGWTVSELVVIAEHLNTTVAYLVGETENPHPGDGPDGDGGVRHQGLEPRTQWFSNTPSRVRIAGALFRRSDQIDEAA